MRRVRIIPVLLLDKGKLVKTVKFKNPRYVGDPINAVRIFNDKEVDELVLLDITATKNGTGPDFRHLADIASEAFMPMAYGGGITSLEHIQRLLQLGFEKVVLQSAALDHPALLTQAAARFGAQSIVVSIDVRKDWLGRQRAARDGGAKSLSESPESIARRMEDMGAGELLLCAVDREGTYEGYDLELIRAVTAAVSIPVVASGGAGKLSDFHQAVAGAHASAAAAGSMFVFQRPHQAVLISYPKPPELKEQVFAHLS